MAERSEYEAWLAEYKAEHSEYKAACLYYQVGHEKHQSLDGKHLG